VLPHCSIELFAPPATAMNSGDVHYKLMRLLQANPEMSQRDLARELGISLGKANYCLQALIKKGWIKATNFTNSQNKAAYMYLLTPRGLEEKASLTVEFLQIKMREYEALRAEIKQMRREAKAGASTRAPAVGRKLRDESSP
jgi:EPS-associated MarR family transcriptional regulator